MLRFSACALARSEVVLAVAQLKEGRGASTSAKSRAATSMKLAIIGAGIDSGKKSGNMFDISPRRTDKTLDIRTSRSELRRFNASTLSAICCTSSAIQTPIGMLQNIVLQQGHLD